ncbi:MAG: MFS transporter [Sphaerobacter sp.]|nr:MFS transporter [Sphaerobacter sp.]MDI3341385.1 MFS transporter [Sphaerobacter sp.]
MALEDRITEPVATASDVGAARERQGPFAAFRERPYRVLWFGMLPSMLAMQMGQVAVGYVAYRISGEATALGLIAAGSGLPMLVFALAGGVVADRMPKRTVLFFTQGTIGLVALINALLVLTGAIQVWHLVAASAVQGTAFAFNMPTRQAFIAEIVTPARLMNAIALNNAGMNMSRVVGPALAGALIAMPLVGPGGVFAVMAAMYVVVLLMLFLLPPGRPARAPRGGGLAELKAGLRYVARQPTLRMLLGLAVVPVLLGMPYVQMMPVFALDVFHVGSRGLGTLMAVNGLGALAGSLGVAAASGLRRKGLLQLTLGLTFGLALALFALGGSFPLGLVAIAVAGAASAGYSTLNSTLIMTHTEHAFHGRVMSLYMMTFAMMPLGTVPLSWLVDHIGAPLTVGLAGLLLSAIIGGVALASPSYRRV